MKKILKVFLLTSSLLLLASCSVQKTEPEPLRVISVSGKGSVSVKPDIVTLKFIVKTSEWNVSFAAEKNATNTANVLAALKEAGVSEADISTYDYKITQDNSNTYAGKYTITNTICVVVRNIEATGKVIDAAVKNNIGANGIISFEYSLSDNTSALRQARTLAVQNAQDAAALLAGASGCKIGTVQEIHEDYISTARNTFAYTEAKLMDSTGSVTTPIEAGNMEISSNIRVTYSLIN